MTNTVSLPLWLVILISILAAWAFLARVIWPIIRWYFRRRHHIAINKINERLDLSLPVFKLTKQRILIDRLIYDPHVQKAIEDLCREKGIPRKKAIEKVKRYAKEIIPSFNAYLYSWLGSSLGKSLARMLYRVRIGFADEKGLEKVDKNASVVFIMNHRSNMDYVLLSFLSFNRVALSFAVGEWARVWPLKPLIKAMGGFFVRRGSQNPLYRHVLARYVHMQTEGGVVQAVFPEGRLSRDGKLGPPRVGLLDYMLRDFNPEGERDIVFIPVGVNYDRVFEDRSLLREKDPGAKKKSPLKVTKTTLSFLLRNLRLKLRGGLYRFGYAVANFGTPISIKEYIKTHKIDFRRMEKTERIEKVKLLAQDLMREIAKVIPVAPVSLIASVFVENPDKAFSDLEIMARVQTLIGELEKHGAHAYIPRGDRTYAIRVGLRMLILRHLVLEEDSLYSAATDGIKLLHYYANSLIHFMKN